MKFSTFFLLFASFFNFAWAHVGTNETHIVTCQDQYAHLKCDPGHVIQIKLANFGRFSVKVCNENNEPVVDGYCTNHKTLDVLRDKCDGKLECSQRARLQDFDGMENTCANMDPLFFYLELSYACMPEPTTTTTTTTTAPPTPEPVVHDLPNVIVENRRPKITNPTAKALFCNSRKINGVEYKSTPAGYTSVKELCMAGAEGLTWWYCQPDGTWRGKFPNTTDCVSHWAVSKRQLLQELKQKKEAAGIADFIRGLASDTRRPMQAGDLPNLLHLVQQVAETLTTEKWTEDVRTLCNDKLIELVNHVSRSPEAWYSWSSDIKRKFASGLLAAMEKIIAWSTASPKAFSNVYAQPSVTVQISDSLKALQPMQYVTLPSAPIWEDFNNQDSADVPVDALQSREYYDNAVIYYSSLMNMADYFEPHPVIRVSADMPAGEEIYRKVVSNIVSVSIFAQGKTQKINSIEKPVFITFVHSPDQVRHYSNPECSWWNNDDLQWMSQGCRLQTHNLSHTVCSCSHLTQFAVLMDVRGHELSSFDDQLLTFLTYFGCSLSVVCLILAFFCFLLFAKDGGDRVFIHKNLCLMLALAEVVFLAGIWRTEDKLECSIIAGSLLYLFLSALTWMLLEGYQLYRMLVEVFPTGSKKCLLTLVGYGFPAVVTLVAALYDHDSLGTKTHCWLRTDNLFILAFVGPAAAILALNTIFLMMTFCIICRHSSSGYLPCRHDSETGRNVRTWAKGALAISCLLGVTWSFGLMWIDDNQSIYMAYAFTISNSLQGFFIFVFHVILNERIRKNMRRWLSRHGCCSAGDRDAINRLAKAGAFSPSNGSGSGSDFLYSSSEKYHSSPRQIEVSTPYGHQALMQQYQHHIAPQGVYDYATIQYGDMQSCGPMKSPLNYRQPPEYRQYGGTIYREQMYGTGSMKPMMSFHRPPPEFSPPPPPQNVSKALYYAARRPPSSKMSDDSAYSEGGSSMLATEVTPTGATVLRMDLSKNPPLYCQDL